MPHPLTNTLAFRRQALLTEFASLRTTAPRHIYLTLSPTNPTLWHGLYTPSAGPYSGAALTFLLSLSSTLTPELILTTRVLHPLVSPKTGRFQPPAAFSSPDAYDPAGTTALGLLGVFKESFESEGVLDAVTMREAADPGALQAWGKRGGTGGWEKVGEVVKESWRRAVEEGGKGEEVLGGPVMAAAEVAEVVEGVERAAMEGRMGGIGV
ncbi:hypothetical protein EDC01DRAFT_30696 [Geopyxis carbonaria]|nr:hypothetical protein EDC01DRAFT_30696 [Geopyxis carbonaria]